jgi:hypothetical protein
MNGRSLGILSIMSEKMVLDGLLDCQTSPRGFDLARNIVVIVSSHNRKRFIFMHLFKFGFCISRFKAMETQKLNHPMPVHLILFQDRRAEKTGPDPIGHDRLRSLLNDYNEAQFI